MAWAFDSRLDAEQESRKERRQENREASRLRIFAQIQKSNPQLWRNIVKAHTPKLGGS